MYLAGTAREANPRSAERIDRYRERTERLVRARGMKQIDLLTGQRRRSMAAADELGSTGGPTGSD